MNRRNTMLLGAAVALVIFVGMALTIRSTEPWQTEGTQEQSEQANNRAEVVDTLFGPQVIAFEVLGILLTAAMIGALVIARPLGVEPDESHYTHPTAQQVKESLAVSDVKAHALRNKEADP